MSFMNITFPDSSQAAKKKYSNREDLIMFYVYTKDTNSETAVYAVKEENGVLWFLTYIPSATSGWRWVDAANYWARI